MRITAGLNTVQSVSPRIVASMAVLQCGTQELGAYLENLSYENPMMELQEAEQTQPEPLVSAAVEKLRWLKNYDHQNRGYYSDTDRDSVDQYLHSNQEITLEDFVLEQILTMDAPPELIHIMEVIAGLLDRRGLYTGTVAEIAKLASCNETNALEALRLVQTLEPAGVAAESVQQALLMQVARLEKPVVLRLIQEHFSHLGSWSDQRLARAMGISREAVAVAKEFISTLRPYPSNGFGGREEIQYVTPDVSIFTVDGELKIAVEEQFLPTIQINEKYLKMMETEQDPEIRGYLNEKFLQLNQVLENLGRRKSTLLRCGELIALRQADFFHGGSLRALTLRDAAEELELHESTICRAVKNKFIQCSRGVFPMAFFFSRDVGQNVGLCRSSIQTVIQSIIAEEDPRKPLSDEKIAAELANRRISLSRRAVAKYRMELGIPAASARMRDG